MSTKSETPARRPYRKRRRAAQEDETRRRITEAAVDLHGSVGPAKTTISAVAERAGVQRATVYRHFPDEEAIFAACSAHWMSEHPLPDLAAWAAVGDPDERLRTGLGELYAWFERGEEMLEEDDPRRRRGAGAAAGDGGLRAVGRGGGRDADARSP